jgi:hypothetical protein
MMKRGSCNSDTPFLATRTREYESIPFTCLFYFNCELTIEFFFKFLSSSAASFTFDSMVHRNLHAKLETLSDIVFEHMRRRVAVNVNRATDIRILLDSLTCNNILGLLNKKTRNGSCPELMKYHLHC